MIKHVYVMAHAFSGSTLTSFLLGAHPEIATVGEPGIAPGIDVETFFCSCGDLVSKCSFWRLVSDGMKERGLDFDIRHAGLRFRVEDDIIADRLLRAGPKAPFLELARSQAIRMWPKARKELNRLLHRFEMFVGVVTEIQKKNVFVDISKRPGRLVHIRRVPGFDLKVIRLARDARAVAYSCMKNLGLTPEDAARSWVRFQRDSGRVMGLLPTDSCLTVRYEDLCRDPGGTLFQIHQMIGVTPEKEVPDFRAVEHHIIGNRMRLQSASEIRRDDRWQHVLTPPQLDAVDRIAGTENRSLGYAPV